LPVHLNSSGANAENKPSLPFAGDELMNLKQCSDATGLSLHTLQTYITLRRRNVFRGPVPTRVPGTNAIYYRVVDVARYVIDGYTGGSNEEVR
jgi:hypothetical protein